MQYRKLLFSRYPTDSRSIALNEATISRSLIFAPQAFLMLSEKRFSSMVFLTALLPALVLDLLSISSQNLMRLTLSLCIIWASLKMDSWMQGWWLFSTPTLQACRLLQQSSLVMNPLQNSSKMKIRQLISFWLRPSRIFPSTSLKQSDSTQFLQAKSAILNTDYGVSPILAMPLTNICMTSTLPLGVFISISRISFLSAVSASQSAMILLLICTSSPRRVTLLICSSIFLFLSQSSWMRLFCLIIFSLRIFTTSLQSSIVFGYFYMKLYIYLGAWIGSNQADVGSQEGEGEVGRQAEGGVGSQAVHALPHFFHVFGHCLMRLLADLFVFADLLFLLASPFEVLRPLFLNIAAGLDGFIGSNGLHCWNFDYVVLEVNRRLRSWLLVLSDQLFAPFFLLVLGLLAGQGVLTGVGELMQIELIIDDPPPEGQVVLVSKLLVDELQLLVVGLSDLVGPPVVELFEEVCLDLGCHSVRIGQQVQVILEQFSFLLGLVLQQTHLLACQDHTPRQVLPVSLTHQDLLLGQLRYLLELALRVRLKVLQSFLCGLEHADRQVAVAGKVSVEFCLFGLDGLQIGLFGRVLTDILQLSLFSLYLQVPYTLDGVQLFQFFLL